MSTFRASRSTAQLLRQAQEAFVKDLQLGPRPPVSASHEHLDEVAQALVLGHKYPLVYTAFDGDHFILTPAMRIYCLKRQKVPANPESILGYRDTLVQRGSKRGVLLDDLSVLNRCDELWVFTDLECSLQTIHQLADGVLVELLYFLAVCPGKPVRFISATGLATGDEPDARECLLEYLDVVQSIRCHGGDSLVNFVEEIVGGEIGLPKVTYVVLDPRDSKYMHFVRPFALSLGIVAIVPGLAIEHSDAVIIDQGKHHELACLLVSWTRLIWLADEMWTIAPMDGECWSETARTLVKAWSLINSKAHRVDISWDAVRIPPKEGVILKAASPQDWFLGERKIRASG